VTSRIYPFVQVEMPFELGVPDGRWMVRDHRSMEVQQVLVLRTIHAKPANKRRAYERSAHERNADKRNADKRNADKRHADEPQEVPITSITIVSATALEDETAARHWLDHLDPAEEAQTAFVALNTLLRAHRIAAADPYAHEVAPAQGLALRAGFGVGEQVAEGRSQQTRRLQLPRPRRWQRGRRAAILRSQERLARLLSSSQGALLCEELALRARLDLDNGCLALAAGELERGLSVALTELEGERGQGQGQGFDRRVAELRDLLGGVEEVVARLLPGAHKPHRNQSATASETGATATAPETSATASKTGASASGTGLEQHAVSATTPTGLPQAAGEESCEEVLSYALSRLEAALRARAVALAWR
jgi:hypothetical protein